MNNSKLLLFVAISLFTSTLYAQSFDIDTDPRYNDFYECDLESGEKMSIHLHHLRITRTTIEVFGQTFNGLGTFHDIIRASDKNAHHNQAQTLHIIREASYGVPTSVDVYRTQTRAPDSYKLDCHKL